MIRTLMDIDIDIIKIYPKQYWTMGDVFKPQQKPAYRNINVKCGKRKMKSY
jgi:hypothetical protein